MLPDYGITANDWAFYHANENLEAFTNQELRMKSFNKVVPKL